MLAIPPRLQLVLLVVYILSDVARNGLIKQVLRVPLRNISLFNRFIGSNIIALPID